MTRKDEQTHPRLPTDPGDQGLDKSLVHEFINAAVEEPDKARQMLKTNPGLLRARWRLGETPLHFLAIEGYLDGVRLLGQLGIDVNAANELGDTALTEVVTLGNAQMVEELLRLGADVNVTSKLRTNPLHCAMEGGHWDIAKLLIKAGARSDYSGAMGRRFSLWTDRTASRATGTKLVPVVNTGVIWTSTNGGVRGLCRPRRSSLRRNHKQNCTSRCRSLTQNRLRTSINQD
jgi:hypothetical protein